MKYDKSTALKAHKLHTGGKRPKEIGVTLRISTDAARHLVDIGRAHQHLEDAALTKPETLLILSVGNVHLRNLERGVTRSPESKEVAWEAGKGHGWPAATANRRLYKARCEDNGLISHGLGLVEMTGNGYANLTEAGWAVYSGLKLVADLRRERELLFLEIGRMREALVGFDDDFQTSEHHHPRHVLIPTEVFERVRAVAGQSAANPAA